MTIIILFHTSSYLNFKSFYNDFVSQHLSSFFPRLVSYNRFVELMPTTCLPLCSYLHQRKGVVTKIAFIDSTPITVCHPKKASSNKVFKELAKWGKNSMGWFFGFKLHLIINEYGELLAFKITTANLKSNTLDTVVWPISWSI